MRAYADLLMQAMSRHAPDVDLHLVELEPELPGGALARRWRTISLPLRAWRQRRLSPDVWHVLDASRAYVAPALGSSPIVITAHDIIPWLQHGGRFAGVPRLGIAARCLWRENARALRNATTVLCVSSSTANDVQSAFGVRQERCRVASMSLNVSMSEQLAKRGAEQREAATLLHVGNAGFYKNRAGVLRVFALVAGRCHGARLIMAGPEPGHALLELARNLGVADSVHWRIDPGDEELAQCYRRASVMVFPSLYEGFGWPVLEAMSFGLPLVTSSAGSLPEVVGESAACFDPANELGMAEAVVGLLASPEAYAAAVERGLARARAFSETAFAGVVRDAYLAAAGRTEKRTT